MSDKDNAFNGKEDRIVYVRSVEANDLPDDIRAQLPKETLLYAPMANTRQAWPRDHGRHT